MDSTEATPVISNTELVITTSDIAIDTSIDSPTGTFRESSPAEISITTDNYTGYSLSINAKDDTESSSKLINSDETAEINSITSISTQDDFTSNTWGIKPNKVEGNDNINYLPAPTIEGTNIDTTTQANAEPNTYTMSIATKVDYDLPADKYSSNMLIIVVGNPTIYTIEYDKNVDGDASNMPATQASDTQDTSVTLASNKPTSAKKYKFLSWCDGTVIDHDGIPECTGTVYNPGDEYDLDQTTDNHVVLYGMWNRVATLTDGYDFRAKVVKLADNNSNNIVAVKLADALPEGFTPSTNNIISINSSPDIYAWWDNTDNAKIIYIYTDASRIKANGNSSEMFKDFRSLVDISGITNLDTSNVAYMNYMFYATKITNIDALAIGQRPGKDYVSWDTSNVTNMSYMFRSASSLTNIDGATNWNTSKVTNMSYMFQLASSLANIDGATNWNTSKVADMSYMFSATKITNIDALATGQRPGKDYVSWDTSNVKNMQRMFSQASSLTNIDGATNWNTTNVVNMSEMFSQASSLTNIDGATNWNTTNVTNISSMFNRTSITNIDALATGQRPGKDYVSWDVSNVKNMQSMFSGASALANIDGATNWNTSNVTNMGYMFQLASSLANIDGATNWDTSNVTNMNSMFNHAASIVNIDALATGQRPGKDYVSWVVSKVTDMGYMFSGTSALANIDGATNWDTSSVTYMGMMFNNASSLTNIDGATNWDTSNVTDMYAMFFGSSITNIDALATGQRPGKDYVSWNVSNVKNMTKMFYDCTSLTDPDDLDPLNSWTVNASLSKTEMFYGIPSSVLRPTWY